jgi:hypothetical protein
VHVKVQDTDTVPIVGLDDSPLAEDNEPSTFTDFDVDAAVTGGSDGGTVTDEFDGTSVSDRGETHDDTTLATGDVNGQQQGNIVPPPSHSQGRTDSTSAEQDESVITTAAVTVENTGTCNHVAAALPSQGGRIDTDNRVSNQGSNVGPTALSLGHGDNGQGGNISDKDGRNEQTEQGEGRSGCPATDAALTTMEGSSAATPTASSSTTVGGNDNPVRNEVFPKDSLLKVEEALIENAKDVADFKLQVRRLNERVAHCGDAVREAEELLLKRKREQQEATTMLEENKKRQKCAEERRLELKQEFEAELGRYRKHCLGE